MKEFRLVLFQSFKANNVNIWSCLVAYKMIQVQLNCILACLLKKVQYSEQKNLDQEQWNTIQQYYYNCPPSKDQNVLSETMCDPTAQDQLWVRIPCFKNSAKTQWKASFAIVTLLQTSSRTHPRTKTFKELGQSTLSHSFPSSHFPYPPLSLPICPPIPVPLPYIIPWTRNALDRHRTSELEMR